MKPGMVLPRHHSHRAAAHHSAADEAGRGRQLEVGLVERRRPVEVALDELDHLVHARLLVVVDPPEHGD